MATPVTSVPSVSDALHAVAGEYSSRQRIVAVARHIASVGGLRAPSTFRSDADCPTELLAALTEIDDEHFTVDCLGSTWEQLLDGEDRRAHGAHFTPRIVADRVASLALELLPHSGGLAAPRVWDPACGGGAFLLAAARWFARERNLTRAEIVSSMYASDIDPTALDVCDASLELWCGGAARPTTAQADALLDLPDRWPELFEVVIGNPPFLGQLTSDTTRTQQRRHKLVKTYASAQGAYVDEAGLFVELAVQRSTTAGIVALVVPESILGARDAEAMRASVLTQATLARLWVDEGQSFEASVDVVALILANGSAASDGRTSIAVGVSEPVEMTEVQTPQGKSWAPLLANALGVPTVKLSTSADHTCLSDRATVTAGFRQHFYGIATAVAEAEPGHDHYQKLITSGTIEPLWSMWASRPVKFAGQKWNAPVLRLDAIEDERVREWFQARCVPKLLLASQTRVVEAIVDPDGSLVPSVPVISVEPTNPDELWHLAAALTAPAVSAAMLTEAAGTGLSHDAIRLRAATLSALPLPPPGEHWDAGARHARRAHQAGERQDSGSYVSALDDLAAAMNAAYGVGEHVASWWRKRIRVPTGSETTPAAPKRLR